ncbi:putative myosin heavy chain MYA2-related [Trypanosoma theileri]|uniref:Putative myosin heavy chain MYA2-related n=1 Tax=Trypanosoma theileri TaxID=67003 RepID=A0A1X0P8M1_9TRYP|nr:putative myosin heavy chain MYA2-related [Trypanosoma theileri]ORC93297.1 putative myosin heavy chain MYA2-related [Trypanosoma theileri]
MVNIPVSRIGAPAAFLTTENEWVLGKVTAYDASSDTYSLSATEPEFVTVDNLSQNSKRLWLPQAEAVNEDVDDLLNLTELHEASLLFCLKKRYLRDVVYTNIGPIVIALNPFNYSIPWYAESKMDAYLEEENVIEKNLPHLWSMAHNTYWEMIESSQNQTILISGDSGAGKTEAAKIVLKYLGALSTKIGVFEDREGFVQVNKSVLAASPILESFGNAKTVRNDNSSRFGKFSKVQFNANGILVGCHITKYLLEKSRIIVAAAGERVYHSYYQLSKGPLAKEFSLRNPKVYRVLNAGGCINVDGIDDAVEYMSTKRAMDDVGITNEEQLSIWQIVAGGLFLQNTDFVESEERSGRVAKLDSNLLPVLGRVCELWGINEEEFKKELVSTSIITQKERMIKPLNKVKALDIRDSVCKAMYDWLFDWLVFKINETTNRDSITSYWIGLLDIFGFENFQKNSFEQLCINLTNEVLQGHYNQHTFVLDMRDCHNEGIDTTRVSFVDNKDCIDLLMGKIGIFTLLDEECAVSGNERNYLHKLIEKFGPNKSKGGSAYFLQASGRFVDNHFIIKHYAADVQYCVDGFLDKNRDTLKDTMREILMRSKLSLITKIVQHGENKSSSKGTVGGHFIKQLIDLMSVINTTNPHWIRCIKPNANRHPREFSNTLVMQQLRSAGVLETITIRKAGYPIRFKYSEILKRYRVLYTGNIMQDKEACQEILQSCHIDSIQAQLGKTKVFMKHEAFLILNRAREQAIIKFLFVIQRIGRGSIGRGELFTKFLVLHRQRILEERRIREEELKRQRELEEKKRIAEEAERVRREILMKERQNKAALTIQKLIRGVLCRKRFLMMYLSILRAREEHTRDNDLQKYRMNEININKKMRLLESRINEQKEFKGSLTSTKRRDLINERREHTMQLLTETRMLNKINQEKEIAQEMERQVKEAARRKRDSKEVWKCKVKEDEQPEQIFHNVIEILQGDEQKRFFSEMMTRLNKMDMENESRVNTSYTVPKRDNDEDSSFNKSKQHWEEKERWMDEREGLLGPFHEPHALPLRRQQRRLEEEYRIQTMSKVLWQSDAKMAALSFRQERDLQKEKKGNNSYFGLK